MDRLNELGGKPEGVLLELSLDRLSEDFVYDLYRSKFDSQYELHGRGHSWTILARDKEKFLDEFAQKFRTCVEELLVESEETV